VLLLTRIRKAFFCELSASPDLVGVTGDLSSGCRPPAWMLRFDVP
jgi:hypothetical protein